MIYIIILLYIALLSFLYEFSNVRLFKSVNKWCLFITLVSLAGFRYRVGGDTYYYMLLFELLPEISEVFSANTGLVKLQPLWLFLNGISKAISPEFYVFQLIHALIVNSVVFYFFGKHSRYFFTSILFYYFIFYGSYNFEILRESLAICVFLLGFIFLLEKKWIKYFLLVSISFGFHYSAIILFFLPFFLRINLTIGRVTLFSIFAIILNFYIVKIVASVSGIDGISVTLATYSDYTYSIFGLLAILLLKIVYPFSVLKFNQRYGVNSENNKLLVFTEFYILGGILSLMFYIFFRSANYFLPFFVVLLVDTVHQIARSKLFKDFKITSAVVIFISIFFIHTHGYFIDTSHKVASSLWINQWYPYYSIFDPKKDPIREELYEQD